MTAGGVLHRQDSVMLVWTQSRVHTRWKRKRGGAADRAVASVVRPIAEWLDGASDRAVDHAPRGHV